jgi:hypothetical protein
MQNSEVCGVGVRAVLCAIIEQSAHDAKFCKGTNKALAVKFLSSDTYETICETLNLPADTIRNSIYDTRHNQSTKREGRPNKKRVRPQKVQGELRLDLQEEGGTEK